MLLIIFAFIFVLAVIGICDSFFRCVAFAMDNTRGSFARVAVGLAGFSIMAVTRFFIKPIFDGSLEGLGALAYLFGVAGPFALVCAVLGLYAINRPPPPRM